MMMLLTSLLWMGQLMHYLFQVDMCMSLTFAAKEHFESVSVADVPGVKLD